MICVLSHILLTYSSNPRIKDFRQYNFNSQFEEFWGYKVYHKYTILWFILKPILYIIQANNIIIL